MIKIDIELDDNLDDSFYRSLLMRDQKPNQTLHWLLFHVRRVGERF